LDGGGSVNPELTDGYRYLAGGYDDPATYERLSTLLDELDAARGTGGTRVFYLSTPPEAFRPIVTGLGGAGLSRRGGIARVVIEKPYGTDERTAEQLDATVHAIEHALKEAEALAWETGVPELVLLTLAEEKAAGVALWHDRQESMRHHGQLRVFAE
jgi:hypothetical protein